MGAVEGKCKSCGGRLVSTTNKELYVCEFCGSTEIIKSDVYNVNYYVQADELELSSKNKDFRILGGVLISYHGKGTIVGIPEGVTVIGDNAFENQHGIKKVIIPNSVKNIGKRAFANCKNLEAVYCYSFFIRDIADETFYNCSSLKEFTIPWGCERIGKRAFANCQMLTILKEDERTTYHIKYIDEEAFSECTSLETIDFFRTIITHECMSTVSPRDIGEKAFYNCKNLYIDKEWFSFLASNIKAYTFYGCGKLKEIYLPTLSVGEYAFSCCNSLTHVRFDNGITLKQGAFMNCVNLSKISFSDKLWNKSAGQSMVISCKQSFENTPIFEERKKRFLNKKCLLCGGDIKHKVKNGVHYFPYLIARTCVECDTIQFYEEDCVLGSDLELMQPERMKRNLCKYCGHSFRIQDKDKKIPICVKCGKPKDY